MKLTYIEYRAVCPNEQQLFRELRDCGINAQGSVMRGGEVFFSAAFTRRKQVEAILTELNSDWSVCGRGMFVRFAEAAGRRS